MKLPVLPLALTFTLALWVTATPAAVIATFDDLVNPPLPTAALSLGEANGNSLSYDGVVWDARLRVVGDAYRVDPPAGPLFGLPASGHWYITNSDGADGLTLTTTLVLTSAAFGQNEYYGYGGGADQVTVSALHGSTVLASLSLSLPDNHPGQPEPLQLLNTSSFLALGGITGYRIDRHAPAVFRDSWVGDNFVFQAVPEASTAWLLLLGLGGLRAWWAVARARRQRFAGAAVGGSAACRCREGAQK